MTAPDSGNPPAPHRPKPAWLKKPFDRYERQRAAAAVGDLLDAVIDRNGLTDEMRACALFLRWPEIVSERIARRARPDGFFKSVLWVKVDNSSWLHELTSMKPELLRAVRAAAGTLVIEDLKLHLGRRQDADPDDPLAEVARLTALARRPPRRLPPPPPATGAARDAIERDAAAVEDDELRAIVRDVRIRFDK